MRALIFIKRFFVLNLNGIHFFKFPHTVYENLPIYFIVILNLINYWYFGFLQSFKFTERVNLEAKLHSLGYLNGSKMDHSGLALYPGWPRSRLGQRVQPAASWHVICQESPDESFTPVEISCKLPLMYLNPLSLRKLQFILLFPILIT